MWSIAHHHDDSHTPTHKQYATKAVDGEALDFLPARPTEADEAVRREGNHVRALMSCSMTQCGTRAIFSCDDGSVRVCDWDPTSASHGRELVQYRRYLSKLSAHTRTCTNRVVSIAVVRAEITLKSDTKVDPANELHTLVRFADGTVKLVDLSYVDRGFPPGSVLWENYKYIGLDDWFTWLSSIVRSSQPTGAVFAPSPPGIWHQRLPNHRNLPYQLILDSEGSDDASRIERLQAVCADKHLVEILSTALHYTPRIVSNGSQSAGTALTIAMDHKNQMQVQRILDDYSAFTEQGQLPARNEGWVMSEASVVQLFDTFPEMARAFMSSLQLRRVFELDPSRKCTFNLQDPDIVRDASSPLPTEGPMLSAWWDVHIRNYHLDDTILAPDHDKSTTFSE
eukprot:COSAG02_NODE_14829_length_1232_cov_1.111209_1_plen_395_part_10